MVIIGVDAHKQTHTLVAVDTVGRELAQMVIDAIPSGHAHGLRWATTAFGTDVTWAIEDVRHVSRGLETSLVNAGQRVVRVPTKLMARTRASARTRGKSDPIDALAIGRAVLREPHLPLAGPEGPSRDLKLLVDRRDDLVLQRTATMNRLVWHIHELDPARATKPSSWLAVQHREALLEWLCAQRGLIAELAADELTDVSHFSESINVLQKRLAKMVKAQHPNLLACRAVVRFRRQRSPPKPPTSPGSAMRRRSRGMQALRPPHRGRELTVVAMRAGRSGNRQLNRALHKIAITQIRLGAPGRTYYQRRIDSGDNGPTALRCLKRKIARVVYRCLLADAQSPNRQPHPLKPDVFRLA